jgi:hypothetical protein
MKSANRNYRFLSDTEPEETELKTLMHEVAIDAEKKSDIANRNLLQKIKIQSIEALVREGYRPR